MALRLDKVGSVSLGFSLRGYYDWKIVRNTVMDSGVKDEKPLQKTCDRENLEEENL